MNAEVSATLALPAVLAPRIPHSLKPRKLSRKGKNVGVDFDEKRYQTISMSASLGESGNRGESLFDNIEITNEERETIAARLKERRLRKRRTVNSDTRRRRNKPDENGSFDENSAGNRFVKPGSESRRKGYSRPSGSRASRRSSRYETNGGEDEDTYFGWGEELGANQSWDSDSEYYETRNAAEESDISDASISDEYQDTTKILDPPDIVILSPDELDRVLPILPFAAQASFFMGGAAQAVQRWAASLALTVLFSKAALLAATSLTWPLWWPWARAANRNYGIRSKIEYGGIWRTSVLKVEKGNRPRPKLSGTDKDEDYGVPRFTAMKSCRIIIGEDDGAQIELTLPYDARFDVLQPGQLAEVVVLSNSTSFDDIKAVKDVYLPENGLWLSEYPYLDRSEFLEISLDIEREYQSMKD